jgi:hypothetical protein
VYAGWSWLRGKHLGLLGWWEAVMKTVGLQVKRRVIFAGLAVLLVIVALLAFSSEALAAPSITVSPTSGGKGTRVTVSATNFDSYAGDRLGVFFNELEVADEAVTVPDSGDFSTHFSVPGDAAPGEAWITVRDQFGSILARNSFVVDRTAMTLDIKQGPVGTAVTVEGQGFYAGRRVTFYYHNTDRYRLGSGLSTATGMCSYRFAIPTSTAGVHRVAAEDTYGNLAEATFEVLPWLTLSVSSGAPGHTVTASGTGFGYRAAISIDFAGHQVASGRTNEYGSFEVGFTVPQVRPGTLYLRAVDTGGNSASAEFTVSAGASMDRTSGPVGAEVTAKGSGFTPGAVASVSYDGMEVARGAVDNNGVFSIVFRVPPSSGGRHVVAISDGVNRKEFTFMVESVPPPVPRLLLPAEGTESRPETYFDWESVSDPSMPVTYTLQVAADQNFASVVLEKERIGASEYRLQGEESLTAYAKTSTYYWRVRAVDAASNESDWSLASSFYVAPPPVPVLLLPEPEVRVPGLIRFDWEDVVGLSPPVTYTLQIASDSQFSSIVLEKGGLTRSEYTLTGEEMDTLEGAGPYYWRVKVVDSAGSESNWSELQPFRAGTESWLPAWAVYMLIGLGVIILGLLVFWLGRRTAYYQGIL